MVSRAREALGGGVDLRLADAQALPYEDASSDVVTATLVLHELSPEVRDVVATEMRRVLVPGGLLVLVDFHVGPLRGVKGWTLRSLSVVAELVARHLHRSREFLADGGVPALAERLGMQVQRTTVLAGGNLAIHQLRAG